jgi:hypothetical protein
MAANLYLADGLSARDLFYVLQGEERILLRRTEATRDWFTAITEAANRSRYIFYKYTHFLFPVAFSPGIEIQQYARIIQYIFFTSPRYYTVNKGYSFFHLQPGCHLPNSPWPGIIKLFPASGNLVSDTSGDGKTTNLFFTVYAQITLYMIGEKLSALTLKDDL